MRKACRLPARTPRRYQWHAPPPRPEERRQMSLAAECLLSTEHWGPVSLGTDWSVSRSRREKGCCAVLGPVLTAKNRPSLSANRLNSTNFARASFVLPLLACMRKDWRG